MSKKALTIRENFLWNSTGSLVYLGCQWLITVIVVRLSQGYDTAGLLALGMSISNIFSPIGYYKIRTYQVSDKNREFSAGEYIALRILTTIASAGCMIIYTLATCIPNTWPAILAYCLYSLGPIFVDVLHGECQQRDRMDIIGKSLIARGFLSLGVFSLSLYCGQTLAITLLLMSVVTFSVIIFYDYPATRSLGSKLIPSFSRRQLLKLIKTCFPAVVALILCSAVPSIPRQIIDAVLGATILGAYSSIAAPTLIIQMGAQYLYAPLLGTFTTYYHKQEIDRFNSLLIKVSLGIAIITILCTCIFVVAGPILFSLLFGNSIIEYLYMLYPLIACTAFTAYSWFIGDLLIVQRDMQGNLIGFMIAFAVCILTTYPFIMLWGANGASYAILASFFFSSVFFLARIRKNLQNKMNTV